MKQIPLYFITGFLGSGKSTVIQNLLKEKKESTIGLILNDFGDLGIDSTLMQQDGLVEIRELTGGQVFCSCLSGRFIDAAASFAEKEIDLLMVETSGLSKPAKLAEILQWIQQLSGSKYSYQGMICVIDASRFLTLFQVLPVLEEQIRFSDSFIVNKTDLADEKTVVRIEEQIASLRDGAKIHRTSFGKLPADPFAFTADAPPLDSVDISVFQGWGDLGRPKTFTLKPLNPVSESGLSRFVEEASRSCYRIKGYVVTDERHLVFVSCTGEQKEITPVPVQSRPAEPGLVCIQRANGTGDKVFPSRWKLLTGGSLRVIPGGEL